MWDRRRPAEISSDFPSQLPLTASRSTPTPMFHLPTALPNLPSPGPSKVPLCRRSSLPRSRVSLFECVGVVPLTFYLLDLPDTVVKSPPVLRKWRLSASCSRHVLSTNLTQVHRPGCPTYSRFLPTLTTYNWPPLFLYAIFGTKTYQSSGVSLLSKVWAYSRRIYRSLVL